MTAALIASAAAAACPDFANPVSYNVGTFPSGVAVGDFNRDGVPDVAVANFDSNNISILLGNANGTLQAAVNYLTGTKPIAIAIADFNSDGVPDLVVANYGSFSASVLLGNGNGTFQDRSDYFSGGGPAYVVVGDFNKDGYMDFAVANSTDGTVTVQLGDGTGGFSTAGGSPYSAGSLPSWIAVADFNSDGNLDLAVSNATSPGAVSILLGAGDGSFSVPTSFAAGANTLSVAVADLNGDGKADILATGYDDNSLTIRLGNGDGTFGSASTFSVPAFPTTIITTDFNRDGKTDFVVLTNNGFTIFQGDGSGSFNSSFAFGASGTPFDIKAVDFNGDGKVDLVVSDGGATVSVLLNSGICWTNCTTFAAPAYYAVGGAPHSVAVGDLNRDGIPDVVVANGTDVAVLLGNSNATLGTATHLTAGTNPVAVAVGDLNRDGILDIAAANNGSDNVSVFLGVGDGTFQAASNYGAHTGPRSITIADVDGHGVPDLIVANEGSNDVSYLQGSGDGSFSPWVNRVFTGACFATAVADFDREGTLDTAVAERVSGIGYVAIIHGNGEPGYSFATGGRPRGIAVGDFNRDGIPDIAAANEVSNEVSILIGNGARASDTAFTVTNYAAGVTPYSVAVGDFDLDGRLDLAVANSGGDSVSILRGNGNGTFAAATTLNVGTGTGPQSVAVADFNRDGIPDLVVADGATGDVAIILNSCPAPDLTITKTHSGTFTEGDTGKTYTITISNNGVVDTSGTVTVVDYLPEGITATNMSGTGWSCNTTTLTCTRSDALAPTMSYAPITVTVNVAINAPTLVSNFAQVSGGNEVNTYNDFAFDNTNIVGVPELIITKSHAGNFTAGQTGAKYKIMVSNAGGAATNATVTVADTLPPGLTATAITSTSWLCDLGTLTCTRPAPALAIPPFSSAGPIYVTVNVANNAASSVTNTATVSGGGEVITSDNTASDLTLIGRVSAAGCPDFAPAVSYPVLSGAIHYAIASADLNRDGKRDLVVANHDTHNVSVFLGNGDGTFGAPAIVPIGTGAMDVAIADFNHDGKLDLVIVDANSSFNILRGNGDGTFQAAVVYNAGAIAERVVVGDFNHDGNPDLAIANFIDNTVSIFQGTVSGTFPARVDYPVGQRPDAIAAADVNHDGILDLVTANAFGSTVSVLYGQGNGTFFPAFNFATGGTPRAVVVGDFNNDGLLDIATANDTQDVTILMGNNETTFAAAIHYPAGRGPTQLAIADVNGDGKSDLIVEDSSDSSVDVLLGNGAGGFSAPMSFRSGTQPAAMAVGDFNGDGKVDVITDANDAYLVVLLGNGVCSSNCGTFAPAVNYSVGSQPKSVATADFNHDGKVDLVTANYGAASVSVRLGNGDGTFATATTFAAGQNPQFVTVGDFNYDGNPDIIVGNNIINKVNVLLGNGDGTFQTAVPYNAGATPQGIAIGDFFGGTVKQDLAVADNDVSANVSVLTNNGDGTFHQPPANNPSAAFPYGIAIGDFNGDGNSDLVVTNGGGSNVVIQTGNNAAGFSAPASFTTGTNPYGVTVGDFNSDGKLDIATANNGSNNVSVLLGNGNGTFGSMTNFPTGTAPTTIVAGDFNGDGKLDLATSNSTSNNVSVLFGDGAGGFSGPVSYATGTGAASVAIADFNGDGKPDLAVANTGANNVSILLSTCLSPDLTVSKSHTGNFTQGDTGKTYTITVTNNGAGPTVGSMTMKDTLPTGLTATGLSGTGWTCDTGTVTCTRSTALAASASSPITLVVSVAQSAPSSVTNTAGVGGGGQVNVVNDSASDATTINQLADLTITKTHVGNFRQGDTGKTYTITVTNSGPGPTSGTVTVTDTLPTGLTATGMSGTGWSCGSLTCTRSDTLFAGQLYPAITLTVNVAGNAPSSVTNTVTVSGGGESNTSNDSASDPTTISNVPDLTITKTHGGNFTQGQQFASYTITVTNSGAVSTSGAVTVVDTLPAGLTLMSISGSGGWICTKATLTCVNNGSLGVGASYAAIQVFVNVNSNAAATVTNTATVSGGGETNTANDTASDPTTVNPSGLIPPTNVIATATSPTQVFVQWDGVTTATQYRIYRGTTVANFRLYTTAPTTNFTDTLVSANTIYVYGIVAMDSGNNSSNISTLDIASTYVFTDDPLVAGVTVQAVHLTQIRTVINAVRVASGLGTVTFTDSSPAGVIIKAIHITELRSDLAQARQNLGMSVLTYSHSTITAGVTFVTAADLQELRDGTK